MRWKFDVVIVSDLHLGARNARTQEMMDFLQAIETNRLIINGDIFECPRLGGLKTQHVQVLEALRNFERRAELTWLIGNHDPSPDWFRGILGIEIEEQTSFRVSGRQYLVAHGHRWDRAMRLPWPIIRSADAIYHAFQLLDPTHKLARGLKAKSKRFLKVVERLQRKAATYAKLNDYDGVVLGHTHTLHDDYENGIHCLNSGCWTERPASFVGVRHGAVRTYVWDGEVTAK